VNACARDVLNFSKNGSFSKGGAHPASSAGLSIDEKSQSLAAPVGKETPRGADASRIAA